MRAATAIYQTTDIYDFSKLAQLMQSSRYLRNGPGIGMTKGI
jgi:hypothetical protein